MKQDKKPQYKVKNWHDVTEKVGYVYTLSAFQSLYFFTFHLVKKFDQNFFFFYTSAHHSLSRLLFSVESDSVGSSWFFAEKHPSVRHSVCWWTGLCSQEETSGAGVTQQPGNQLYCSKTGTSLLSVFVSLSFIFLEECVLFSQMSSCTSIWSFGAN